MYQKMLMHLIATKKAKVDDLLEHYPYHLVYQAYSRLFETVEYYTYPIPELADLGYVEK